MFTGEMIYPWMIDADPVLRPLREAAGILAERDDWAAVVRSRRLAGNEVPVAAACTTTTCTWTASSPSRPPRRPRPADLGDQRVLP